MSVDHTGSGLPHSAAKKDCLVFTVDRDISLVGLTLCGSESSNYSITIKITNLERNHENIVSKSGDYSPEHIKTEQVSYYGFDIFFDRPVVLKGDIRYRLEAWISGSSTCTGLNGKQTVLCSGVRFDFKKCCSKSTSTVENGQFPEIIFAVM